MVQIETFDQILRQYRALYLDANICIYHFEDVSPYSELTQLLFESIQSQRTYGHTSVLSVLEFNVKPYSLGRVNQVLNYSALLDELPNFLIHSLTLEMADKAAQMRVKYRLKTPDAIHVACALTHRCDAILGNDEAFGRVKEIKYIHLDDFV